MQRLWWYHEGSLEGRPNTLRRCSSTASQPNASRLVSVWEESLIRVFAILAAGACLVVTLASAEPIALDEVRWVRQPDAMAFARLYPDRAQDNNVSGTAVLCCTVRDDGSLNCTAPFEWPQEYGFGDASVAISREFRVAPETVEAARATPNAYLRRQIRWQLGPPPSQLAAAFTRISEETQSICEGPAPSGS